MRRKEFHEQQVDKLMIPWEDSTDEGKEAREGWLDFILNFTKRTEAGKWNEKYNVMTFRANYGYHSAMKKIVEDCARQMKVENPNIIVMEEVDDNRVRTWLVGDPDKIKEMVNDELSYDKKRDNTENK